MTRKHSHLTCKNNRKLHSTIEKKTELCSTCVFLHNLQYLQVREAVCHPQRSSRMPPSHDQENQLYPKHCQSQEFHRLLQPEDYVYNIIQCHVFRLTSPKQQSTHKIIFIRDYHLRSLQVENKFCKMYQRHLTFL